MGVRQTPEERRPSDHETGPAPGLPDPQFQHDGCIVLDPFGGSGSTIIACEQTERIGCAIEIDEKYCDVIVKGYYQSRRAQMLVTAPVEGVVCFITLFRCV